MSSGQIRLRALVQACKKKEYTGELYEKKKFSIGRQLKSEYSFEGNWWYVWMKKGMSADIIQLGDTVVTDKEYKVKEIHFYKNYKRGTILLSI